LGVGGEDDLYDIMTDPPIPVEMDIYLGTKVTIREKAKIMMLILLKKTKRDGRSHQ